MKRVPGARTTTRDPEPSVHFGKQLFFRRKLPFSAKQKHLIPPGGVMIPPSEIMIPPGGTMIPPGGIMIPPGGIMTPPGESTESRVHVFIFIF